jgi:hypothetical protein
MRVMISLRMIFPFYGVFILIPLDVTLG